MIVRPADEGWIIYFHRAHALLALKIANALGSGYWPLKEYWVDGLASIAEHDNGQPDWKDRKHLTQQGAPLDYREGSKFELDQAQRVIANAKYKSSFMGLMISLHCHHLYKEETGKKFRSFLAEQKAMRTEVAKHLSLKKTDISGCYQFLRWCDELSLILCQNDVPTNQRKMETGELPGRGIITLHRKEDGDLVLTPGCFIEEKVELAVEYYITSRLQFKNDRDLCESLDMDRPMKQEFTFTSSGK